MDHVPHGTKISFKLFNRVLGQHVKNFIGIGIFLSPKHFEFLGSKVAVEEIEAVVIDGEVAVSVDIGLIDLLLLLLEDDLACNEDVFVVHVVSVEAVELIFATLALEVAGVCEQLGDLGEEGAKEAALGHGSHEVVFEGGEDESVLIDGVHALEGPYVLLRLLEAVIGYVKADDLRFDVPVSSVYVRVSNDVADPLQILSHCEVAVGHNAAVLLEDRQKNGLFNDALKVDFEAGLLARLCPLLQKGDEFLRLLCALLRKVVFVVVSRERHHVVTALLSKVNVIAADESSQIARILSPVQPQLLRHLKNILTVHVTFR